MITVHIYALLTLLGIGFGEVCLADSKQPPNIVILLASDWGWNNVGYHGNNEVITPTIDSLAKEHIILDRFYVYHSSAPTRSSILSGRIPPHCSVDQSDYRKHNPNDTLSGYSGMSLGMSTFAEKLQKKGYYSVFTGKWETGFATDLHLPKNKGFNRFLGIFDDVTDQYTQKYKGDSLRDFAIKTNFYDTDEPPAYIRSNFYTYTQGDTVQHPDILKTQDICLHVLRHLWLDDAPAYAYSETGYMEESFATFTLTRIWEHNINTPLLLFHSFLIPHVPYQVPIAWQQPFVNVTNPNRRKINAMLYYMDNVVGQIVHALKTKKMWDNTLLIMLSDNGGMLKFRAAGNNYPLRGGKGNFFEGGIRVNAIAAGGIIPSKMKGKVINEYIHAADLYPTILDFAGLSQSEMIDTKAQKFKLPAVDGLSMKDLILGKTKKSPRNEIHIGTQALITGNYKIITGTQTNVIHQEPIWPKKDSLQPDPIVGINANQTYNSTFGVINCGTGCIFDIKNDPEERNDLSLTNPALKTMLIERLAELNKTFFNPNRGNPSPLVCYVGVTKWGGFHGPFIPTPNITFT